jgi:general secretion pathway protein K
MRTKLSTDRGFVLIIVIWTAAVLALLMLSFTGTAQSYLRTTAHELESARAEALADSGISLAVIDLLARRKDTAVNARFVSDGSPSACNFNTDDLLILRVHDNGGRINLNLATDSLLRAFFIGLGYDSDAAERYADTLLDYRDRDDDRRPSGAEAKEYRAAGRRFGPKNAPFDNLEELQQVLGFHADLIAAMSPHVTINSASAGLDPRVTRQDLVEIVSRGKARSQQVPFALQVGRLPTDFVIASDQQSFTIHAEARLASGAVYVRETVVEFASNRATTHRFKMWRHGNRTTEASGIAIDQLSRVPC